jgi:ATP-binding cassette subfamily F protein uup
MKAPVTAILTVQEVHKAFGARPVLDGVSCAVHARDRVGLVGLNGAGKSTLLRLLVGQDEPDRGLITRMRGLKLAYVPQEPFFAAEVTVGGALAEGLGERAEALAYELRGVHAALDLPPTDRPVAQLSGGERRRVAIGRALLMAPQLLALDEPTNHLDARTAAWLEERLRQFDGAVLLVTHDRYFLDRVATRIVEIDRGRIYTYDGGYTRFLELQAERLAGESARERARQMFVRRELEWIRRGPKARTTKQQARIDRFDAQVAAAPSAEDKRKEPMTLRLPAGGRLGKTILELRGLTLSAGGRRLIEGLDLVMKPGDRIGVVGENGAGKTTLVRTLVGELAPAAGEVVLGQNTRIAYLDQARAELDDKKTVLEEVAGDSDHVHLEDGPVHVRTFLRMLLFDDRFADTPVGVLSGGERNRVQLARLLRRGGNLLVLDEPTNDLDLMTLGVLEDALADFPGCAFIVSHDRWFLDKVATGILAFADGRAVFHEGNYSDYLARRPARAAPREAPAAPPSPATAAPRPRKLSFKERQELDGIEAAIAAAEAEVARLEAVMQDPLLYKQRAAEVPALVRALDEARAAVERLYTRWQELDALPR